MVNHSSDGNLYDHASAPKFRGGYYEIKLQFYSLLGSLSIEEVMENRSLVHKITKLSSIMISLTS